LTDKSLPLTPAQSAFLQRTVPWYDVRACKVACAGFAGSDRRFFRVSSNDRKKSIVLVVWNSADNDWGRFISVQRDVSPTVPFLPKIFASDDKHGLILEEDLGTITLKRLSDTAALPKTKDAYKRVLDALALWQRIDPHGSVTIASRDMDYQMFLWESGYFAEHCVSEFFGLDSRLGSLWEKERQQIAAEAAELPKVCIHRDFQSENILFRRGAVRFVDYQGARLGPAAYDVASLLHDPYVSSMTVSLCTTLFEYYVSVAPLRVSAQDFRICSIQRLMQALGAYGNLSIHKGKDWYRAYVPVALERLSGVLNGKPRYPALSAIVDACLDACKKQCSSPQRRKVRKGKVD
jgi:hypothetical protein